MQFKALIIASVASVALAQTATSTAAAATSTSSCQAQVILDACKGTIQGQVNACATTDYSCLCMAYTNMVGCYASCPNDLTVGTAQQQRELNCNNASVYGSTTILGTAPATSSTAAATTTSEQSAAASGFASGTPSSTSSTSSPSSTSEANAAENVKVGSGLFAMVAAGIIALL